MRVLIADDNRNIARMFKTLLCQEGIMTDCVFNGMDAVKKARENAYDLVFMDVIMPEMDGFHAIEKIREFDGDVALVMISACTIAHQARSKRSFNIHSFLEKPIYISHIMNIVEEVNKKIIKTSKHTRTCLFIHDQTDKMGDIAGILEDIGYAVTYSEEGEYIIREKQYRLFDLIIINQFPNYKGSITAYQMVSEQYAMEQIVVLIDTSSEHELIQYLSDRNTVRYLARSTPPEEMKRELSAIKSRKEKL